MKVLTINPGSTAVKYFLFEENTLLLKEVFDRKKSAFSKKEKDFLFNLNFDVAVFRVVHGGDITKPSIINKKVLDTIKKMQDYAPIHNKYVSEIIDFFNHSLPDKKKIAVFDTSFHQTIKEQKTTYPIPLQFKNDGIRKYGFHGIALEYITENIDNFAKEKGVNTPKNYIVAHLGGGCSITGIEDGQSVDTTMGITPLEGVMMITRSGSVDPAIFYIIGKKMNFTFDQTLDLLNNQSGFLGLTGTTDTEFIINQAKKNIQPYKLATEVFIESVVKNIYTIYGSMNKKAEAIVFSGGIGHSNEYIRKQILHKTEKIGLTEQNTFTVDVKEEEILLKYANRFK